MQDIEFVLAVGYKSGYETYPDSDSAVLPTGSACSTASHVRREYPDLKRRYPIFRDLYDKMGENYPRSPPFDVAYPAWAELGLQL